MEDMSKKGKRLEKENDGLKRQKDATAANILRMAEERQEFKKRMEEAELKSEKLAKIIQAMQKQGRPVPTSMAATMESCFSDSHGGDEVDESDYSEDDGEGEHDSDLDEETDDEPQPVTYGPERPPQHPINGH